MIKYFKSTLLFTTCFIFLCSVSQGQVNFIFNPSASGRDMRGLSSVQLINTSGESYIGTIEIDIRSIDRGFSIVKLFMNEVSVLPGNNRIPATKFGSASVVYHPGLEGNYVKQTGQMPEGELDFCFKLTITSKNSPNEVYDNCFTGTNLSATPLELVSPDNGDQTCLKRPRFTWQPPLPLTPGTSFTLKLVSKKAGQSPAEALLSNSPIIYQRYIAGYVLPYPTGIADLLEGDNYVWQVSTESKGKQTVSEIWEFTIVCDKEEISNGGFRELKSADDGGFLTTGSSLRFALYNPYVGGDLKYSITDMENPGRKIKGLPTIALQKGINNVLVDLRKVSGITDDKEYKLIVELPDGGKVSLRFKYDEDAE